jgi:hypothetical protein
VSELILKLSDVSDKSQQIYFGKPPQPVKEVKGAKSHFIPENGAPAEEEKFILIS